jgi:hypothetical protein
MVLFLLNTVIHVSLLLCLRILIVCLCIFIVPVGTLQLPWMRVFRAFPSVVRQMPGYNPQRRGTARTRPNFLCCSVYYLFCVILCTVWPGTHYSHVTWAHVILRVYLGYFNFQFWRRITLMSIGLRHVILRGALVGSRASTPPKFLMSHTFHETWRTCRVLFRHCYQLFPELDEMLIENCANGPFVWHQVTRL